MYLYISKLTAHVFNTSQSIMNVWKYNWVTLTCDWHYVEQSPHRLRADVTEPVFGDQQLGQVKGHLARDGALHLSPAVRVLHTNIQTTQCQEAFRVCVITVGLFCTFWIYIYILFYHIYIYGFSRCYYPKRLTVHSGYTFFVSMCVPWKLNPQPFALLMQCSFTEPQEHNIIVFQQDLIIFFTVLSLSFAYRQTHTHTHTYSLKMQPSNQHAV